MSDTAASPERLDIGRVLRTTVEVTRRNLGPMLLLAAIFGSLPALVIDFAAALAHVPAQSVSLLDRSVSLVLGVILQGALIHLTLTDLDGRQSTWTQGASAGLKTFRGLLGISFIVGAGVFLGFILFVVPGVMLGVMWCVAGPVLVSERRSLSPAFTRSATLTRGHRWTILALLMIYWFSVALIVLVVSFGLGVLIGIFADAGSATLVGTALASLIMGLVNGPIFAVLYTELRRLKEGATQIAEVFD
ncbi:hypothetical protein [Phenylobacterium aquaticum]|uniref:hypothetical protein n=1 Tax=Phenylobacterium aquaticum TaxID=1763816 RepID=UPI001F5DB4B6|nr:hypothetical protein [Phenylobacterium aquaticum]MCI3134889.1 hypothetical protein [Phenylobacterium aquaticum]